MVRRSTVDRGPHPGAYADYGQLAGEHAHEGTEERTAGPWRGGGGRWLVWVLRGLVWLVLLVIGYRGVTAIIFSETIPTAAPAAPAHRGTDAFPVALASAYALAFGEVYLNANPASTRQRAGELATFLPAGSDPQLGWNQRGSLRLQSEQVAGVRVHDSHQGVVTLLARVNGQLMELGVPIYATSGRLAVSGEPAWLPAPARAALPPTSPVSSDSAAQAALMKQLPAFFQAYASGNQATLSRFLAPGATVTGLGGEVTFGALTGLTVPAGGRTRNAIATVRWRIRGPLAASQGPAGSGGPAGLEVTYALTIVRRGGTWYIRHIGSSTLDPGLP